MVTCVAAAAAVALVVGRNGSSPDVTPAVTRPAPKARPRVGRSPPPALVERGTGTLTAPVQDAAAVALGAGRAMLLGGLTAADTSRAEIVLATPAGDRAAGQLPTAVHDSAAVRLGGSVYLFGGGTNAGTQSDAIVRVPAAGGSATVVGRLPAPSSDQAAAAIGRHGLRRRRLHGQPLARDDRRLAARLGGTGGRPAAVHPPLRGGDDGREAGS